MTSAFAIVDTRDSDSILAIDQPDGGTFMLGPDARHVLVGPISALQSSTILGPLEVDVLGGGRVQYARFEFQQKSGSIMDGDSWLPFLSAGIPIGAASQTDEDGQPTMSRRRLLASAGVALGGGVLAASQAARGADTTISVVDAELSVNDGHVLRLRDEVASVLPTTQEYAVLLDNVQVGTLTPREPTINLGKGRTGDLQILTTADVSTWQSILTRVFGADDGGPQTFEFQLPATADTFDEDEPVTITTDSTIVGAVTDAEPDRTVAELGDQSLRHNTESGNESLGYWTVTDGEVRYVVGPDPPPTRQLTLTAGVGTTTELRDDLSR